MCLRLKDVLIENCTSNTLVKKHFIANTHVAIRALLIIIAPHSVSQRVDRFARTRAARNPAPTHVLHAKNHVFGESA